MKYLTTDIITEIQELVDDQISYLEKKVIPLSFDDLTWKPGRDRWNILEVAEHLNRFGDFYFPKIGNMIAYPKALKKSDKYRSSYFAEFAFKRIRPVNGIVPFKAKATSTTSPFLRNLDRSVIDEHIGHQKKLKRLAGEAKDLNLSKNHIPTMIANWIRLNLGDSIRIVAYHTERHYVQIDNLVNKRSD